MTSARPRPAPITDSHAVPAALLVTAILLLALNLRGPLVAVSAVIDPIRADLGIDAATAGLLTSLPVLCFGIATPLASAVLARLGLARGVLAATGVLLAGIVVRSLDGLPAAITGTLLLGLAITAGNVAIPVVIGRDLPRHAGAVLGAYTAALNVGSMLTLSLTVPIAGATGWRVALASWGVLVVGSAVVWWWATRGSDARPAPPRDAPDGAVVTAWWRRPVVWVLTAAFAGQSFAYYSVTAWLPQLLRDELAMPAARAGAAASVFQIAALAGAFGVPVLLRYTRAVPTVLVVCAAWITIPLGLFLAPQFWTAWCVIGGAAQGGGLVVIFSLIVRVARDSAESRHFSALVQGGGYTVAATGPPVLGAVHAASGGWTAPLAVVLAAIALLAVAGSLAARGVAPTRPGRG
ncbi:CynX/NimT family MFS transporter [Pseudonocardia zijingensis]|uniref:MFS transporter n=1 Tax=Pseudonocardia zijingensis TaxID=153376 RepID=UPI00360BFC11